eukprot:GILI01021831.1.p1 GENE.GILI01021831.1~~GILI01021831.1.p1  ORF type:complete len:334 (+),score=64.32 GILI01021831.1:142-1002(+)
MVEGTWPEPRLGHSSVLIGNRIYVYGGYNGTAVLHDMSVFEIVSEAKESYRWVPFSCPPHSPYLQFHSACVIDGLIYFVGGGDGKRWLDTVWKVDPDTARFSLVAHVGTVNLKGRLQHEATAVGKKIYVFGGEPDRTSQLNDLWIFDTEKLTWTCPTVRGIIPTPRLSVGSFTQDNMLFYYGGFSQGQWLDEIIFFDIATNTWGNVEFLDGPSPGKRCRFRPVVYKGAIYIHGGNEQHRSYDDLWKLKICRWLIKRNFFLVREKGDPSCILRRLPYPLFKLIVELA